MIKVDFDQNLKDLIKEEYDRCIGCKLCMKGCPMLEEFSSNPKDLLKDLNENQYFSSDLPYSCMLCGYCEKVCPKGVSFKEISLKMREVYVASGGGDKEKDKGATGTRFHQDLSFSRVFSKPIKNLGSSVAFFPGCALQADNPQLVDQIYTYLQEIYPGIGYWNTCCGKPTNYLGSHEAFEKRLDGLKTEYREKQVKTLITCCVNCQLSLDENCPDLEIIPIYSVLHENFPKKARDKFQDLDLKVNIQDPCPARFYPSLLDESRDLIKWLGFGIEDLDFSREKTICCSSGGMVWSTRPNIGKKHYDRRVHDGDKPMVTYCKECEMRLGQDRSIDHILDLVFLPKDELFNKHDGSQVRIWKNRFKAQKLAK